MSGCQGFHEKPYFVSIQILLCILAENTNSDSIMEIYHEFMMHKMIMEGNFVCYESRRNSSVGYGHFSCSRVLITASMLVVTSTLYVSKKKVIQVPSM